ncbi:MAG: ABC transporter transmembrane domain-containing protein, partial [Mycobacteriales bacterium]
MLLLLLAGVGLVAAASAQRQRLAALDERVLAVVGPRLRDLVGTPPGLGERWEAVRRTYRVERRLVGLLRPYRRAVVQGVSVTLLITLTGLAKPWPTKILVDDALGHSSFLGLTGRGALVLAVASTVALFLLSGTLGLLQTQLLYGLSQHLIADLRQQVFGHLTRLSLRFHDAKGTGDSVYRVGNDTYAIQSVLLDGLVPLA